MVRYQSETNRYDVHFQYAQIGWYEIHELIVSGKIDLCIATKFEEPEVAGTYIGDHPLVVIVPENHYLASREGWIFGNSRMKILLASIRTGSLLPCCKRHLLP